MRIHKFRKEDGDANGDFKDFEIKDFEGAFILTFLGTAEAINIQGKPGGDYGSVNTNQVQVAIVTDGTHGDFFITPQGFQLEKEWKTNETLIVRAKVQDNLHVELITARPGEINVSM